MTLHEFRQRYQWDMDKNGIGGGGFGSVYKAYDIVENRYVAIKISEVKPEFGDYTLQREFDLVKDLAIHRNIARYKACYRFKTESGISDFAVLKYYELGNLEQFLQKRTREEQPLTAQEKYALVRGILQAIYFLHQNDIIHRDVKAQNVLIDREDGVWVPKMADFGLSRLTHLDISISRGIAISYPYAAPEQLPANDFEENAPKIRANVDLWAIGVMIYRIVEGVNPFMPDSSLNLNQEDARIELIRRIWKVVLPDSLQAMQEPYQTMVRRCLVKDVSKRVQNAGELLALLNQTTIPLPKKGTKIEMGGDKPSQLPAKPVLIFGTVLLVGLIAFGISRPKVRSNSMTLDSNQVLTPINNAVLPIQETINNELPKDKVSPLKTMVATPAPPLEQPKEEIRSTEPIEVHPAIPKENPAPVTAKEADNNNEIYEYESNVDVIRLQQVDWSYLQTRVNCLETGQNLSIQLTINKLGQVEDAKYDSKTSNMDTNRDKKCIEMAKNQARNFFGTAEKNGKRVRFSLVLHAEKK